MLRFGHERKTNHYFTRRRTEVNFPSADWLSYLRTQLTVLVSEANKLFQRCFLETIYSPEGDTFIATSQREFVRLVSDLDSSYTKK